MVIPEWLRARWAMNIDDNDIFPAWYMDDPTLRQLDRIRDIQVEQGFDLNRMPGCKGQAADLIGLFESPEDGDLEILKFFKVSSKGFSQSQAQHEAAVLLADEARRKEWENRSAYPMQREFFVYFGMGQPKEATFKRFKAVIDGVTDRWFELEDSRLGEWELYEALLDDLSDKDVLEMYEIKNPSFKLIRTAVKDVQEAGCALGHSKFDDRVVKRLKELNPKLHRG